MGMTGVTPWQFIEVTTKNFPAPRNKTTRKGNKMAKKSEDSYKLVVKNGNTDYKFNKKTGNYDTKTVDQVEEFSNLADALAEFLFYVADEYGTRKATLTYVPGK